MEKENFVEIIPAKELSIAGIDGLVGRKGTVIDIRYNRKKELMGYWVLLDGEAFMDEYEWFVTKNCVKPIDSLK